MASAKVLACAESRFMAVALVLANGLPETMLEKLVRHCNLKLLG